ncbi:MAG: alpha/beta hydrolase [Proteobacteria bacterium]|nr:alpha/beta hydrolase [Pseudomonadota bacterium]
MSRAPLVFIHGAFCGPWSFDEFRAPFEAKGHAVHVPALRHHALETKPPRALGETSLLDYAADLETFIGGLDSAPVLIGHSLGGLLAQMLAARGLARGIILLAPCSPWGVLPSTIFEMASAQTMMLSGPLYDRILKPDYDVAAAHSLDKLTPPERRRVFAGFVPESGRATFEIMHWGWDARRASHVPAGDVQCPILCLAGQHDVINPPSTLRRMALRYGKHAEFEELAGRSHWLIGEPGWEAVAERCMGWLVAKGFADAKPERKAKKGKA